MELLDGSSLPRAYELAVAAKQRGEDVIHFEIAPVNGVTGFVNLWEDVFGEIRGRLYKEPVESGSGGVAQGRCVDRVIVRASVISVTEAYRRRLEREMRTERMVRTAIVPEDDVAR